MPRKKTVAIITLFYLSFFIVSAEDETQCKVLVDGEDTSREFGRLVAEKGVRIVYLYLKFSNDSYHPLGSKNRILPYRWAWTQSRSEPLLSLSYDYDVLSLGLLNKQARSLDVNLRESPRGCLSGLNASHQDIAITRALMDITSLDSSIAPNERTDVVCTRILQEHAFGFGSGFKYQCCGEYESDNKTMINCGLDIKESEWLKVFNALLAALVTIACLYWPLIFCALPTYFFMAGNSMDYKPNNLPQDQNLNGLREDDGSITNQKNNLVNIPVDDLSPITFKIIFQILEKKVPSVTNISSIKFFLLWFGFVPIFFYIKLGLYFILKNNYFDATSRKLIFQVGDYYLFVFSMDKPLVYVIFLLPLVIIPGTIIFSWKPVERQNFASEPIKRSKNLKKEIISNLKKMPREIFRWTKACFQCRCRCHVPKNSSQTPQTPCCKAILVLCSVVCLLVVVPILVVLGTLIFVLISVRCLFIFSPYFTFVWIARSYIVARTNSKIGFQLISALMFYSSLSMIIVVIFSSQFLVRMLGFMVVGVILNPQFAVPYVTFAFVVAENIYLCFSSLQYRYKEIKDMIAEIWKERMKEKERTKEKELMKEDDTIPLHLFWYVCIGPKPVLPVANEICLMFSKIIAILIFLSIAFAAICLFQMERNFSIIVSTIATFISGKISKFFFTGVTTRRSLNGWHKIRKKKAIQSAVNDYITDISKTQKNCQNVPHDSSSTV